MPSAEFIRARMFRACSSTSTAPFLLAHPVSEEFLPAPVSRGLIGSQATAGPKHAGGLARQPDRHDQPTPLSGPKVPAEQLSYAVHPRPTHTGHPASRLAEFTLDEPGRHLVDADRSEGLGAAPQAASRGPVDSPEARGAPGPGAPAAKGVRLRPLALLRASPQGV